MMVPEQQAFMPEQSKGSDSSSDVFVLVGSNPTECNENTFVHGTGEIVFIDEKFVIRIDNRRLRASRKLGICHVGLLLV